MQIGNILLDTVDIVNVNDYNKSRMPRTSDESLGGRNRHENFGRQGAVSLESCSVTQVRPTL